MPPTRSLTVPLRGRLFPGTSLMCIWANLPLFVWTTGTAWAFDNFRVDTAAHMTEVSEDWANDNDVPIQGPAVTWTITTGSGTTIFTGILGTIRVRVPTWTGVEFEWPCLFRQNRPATLPSQLGMTGVIDDIRLIQDGTPAHNAPLGILRVEEL